MIVSLSKELCEQVVKVDSLRKAQDEGKNIQATLDVLEQIKPELLLLTGAYKLIRAYLPLPDREKLDAQFGRLAQMIKASRQSFETQRRQVVSLTPVMRSELPVLRQSIMASWQSYAQRQISSSSELLSLVESLPELQGQISELHVLRTRLDELAAKMPRSRDHLKEFNSTLDRLTNKLAQLEGLSDAVIHFLRKVMNDEATLADLSPEAAEWCQHGSRSSAFRIKFAKGASKQP